MNEVITRSALVSGCGTYRYTLSRIWDLALPVLVFVMLNPSTAVGSSGGPTIRKCIGFARRLGYGGIKVVNLFAFRATDPADLKRAGYPVGEDNDASILRECAGATVVCAWGRNAAGLARVTTVRVLLANAGAKVHALRLAGDGTPWHPLMLPYSCQLLEMSPWKP